MIVSKDQFRILKERWQSVEDSNYEGIDPRMVSTLCMLNDIPGVVTIWCCSGHTHEELKAANRRHRGIQRRHVSFAFSNYDVLKKFNEIIEYWRLRQSYVNWSMLRDHFSSYQLVWCFGKKPNDVGRLQRYTTWNFEVRYNIDFLKTNSVMERQWGKLITQLCKELGSV